MSRTYVIDHRLDPQCDGLIECLTGFKPDRIISFDERPLTITVTGETCTLRFDVLIFDPKTIGSDDPHVHRHDPEPGSVPTATVEWETHTGSVEPILKWHTRWLRDKLDAETVTVKRRSFIQRIHDFITGRKA